MALIKCPECGKDISDTCDICIHCGYKLKNQQKKDNNHNSNDLQVIAYRGGNGSSIVTVLGILDILFGAGFVVLFIIWVINSNGFKNTLVWAVMICFAVLALGILCIIIGAIGLSRISRSARVQGECILYDKSRNIIVMNTLEGRKIEITPDQFIDIKSNFFTDFIAVVTYRSGTGSTQKVKLGYTAGIERVKSAIFRILSENK